MSRMWMNLNEPLISLELAMLAKQLNFNVLVCHKWNLTKNLNDDCTKIKVDNLHTLHYEFAEGTYSKQEQDWNVVYSKQNEDLTKNLYSAPTQSLLQQWLRKVFDMHISIVPYEFEEGVLFEAVWGLFFLYSDQFNEDQTCSHQTYEDCLEATLINVCNYLINK